VRLIPTYEDTKWKYSVEKLHVQTPQLGGVVGSEIKKFYKTQQLQNVISDDKTCNCRLMNMIDKVEMVQGSDTQYRYNKTQSRRSVAVH